MSNLIWFNLRNIKGFILNTCITIVGYVFVYKDIENCSEREKIFKVVNLIDVGHLVLQNNI